MKKIFSLKSFWIIFFFATVAIFVVDINAGRIYRSETDVLIIPKSAMAAQNSDQIVENLRQLPTALAFYARMIADNEDVSDSTVSELPDYKKKAYWNSELQVVRAGTSGVLRFIAMDSDRYQAETISFQAAATLIGTVGLYYNIGTDLDVRIIDPVVTDQTNGAFDPMLLMESMIGLFLAESIIFYIGTVLIKKKEALRISRPKFFFPYNGSDASPSSESEEKADVLPLEKEWPVEEKPYTDFVNKTKVSSAPANLPVAENDAMLPIQEAKAAPAESVMDHEETSSAEGSTDEEEAPMTREATAEEVKARLNKLLSGQL